VGRGLTESIETFRKKLSTYLSDDTVKFVMDWVEFWREDASGERFCAFLRETTKSSSLVLSLPSSQGPHKAFIRMTLGGTNETSRGYKRNISFLRAKAFFRMTFSRRARDGELQVTAAEYVFFLFPTASSLNFRQLTAIPEGEEEEEKEKGKEKGKEKEE